MLPPDTPLGINEEEYPALKEMVLNLGKFVLVVPASRQEQGTDTRNENAKQFAKANTQPEE
jgi:hypothetical protein